MDLGGDRDNTGKPTPGWGEPVRRAPSPQKRRGGSSDENLRNKINPKEITVIAAYERV